MTILTSKQSFLRLITLGWLFLATLVLGSFYFVLLSIFKNIPLKELTTSKDFKYLGGVFTFMCFLVPCFVYELRYGHRLVNKEIFKKESRSQVLIIIILLTILTPFGAESINIPISWYSDQLLQYSLSLEASYNAQILLFLDFKSLWDLLWALIFVAILPGFVEELFFRNYVQPLCINLVKNAWVGIILGAFIFSLVHFSIIGLFPRMVLGIILGAIFYYTQNLWLSILMHVLNNASIVSTVYYYKDDAIKMKAFLDTSNTIQPFTTMWWVGLLCILPIFYLLKKLKKTAQLNSNILN